MCKAVRSVSGSNRSKATERSRVRSIAADSEDEKADVAVVMITAPPVRLGTRQDTHSLTSLLWMHTSHLQFHSVIADSVLRKDAVASSTTLHTMLHSSQPIIRQAIAGGCTIRMQ